MSPSLPFQLPEKLRRILSSLGSGLLELLLISGFSLALAYFICFWMF